MQVCQVIELDPIGSPVTISLRCGGTRANLRLTTGLGWCSLLPEVNNVKYQLHPWFYELRQNAVEGGMIDAEDAISRYYDGQNRRPRFHGKNRPLAFRPENGPDTVMIDGNRVHVPSKMGGVARTKEVLRWPGKLIRECRFREREGSWYASVRVEVSQEEYGQRCSDGVACIDLGLITFATIAYPDGTHRKVRARSRSGVP